MHVCMVYVCVWKGAARIIERPYILACIQEHAQINGTLFRFSFTFHTKRAFNLTSVRLFVDKQLSKTIRAISNTVCYLRQWLSWQCFLTQI